MESEFREVYNITECAGCSSNIENSPEANSERAEAIAAWFKKEFSDIFESVIEKKTTMKFITVSTSKVRLTVFIFCSIQPQATITRG